MKHIIPSHSKTKGFTLIEMVVAIAIFTAVALVAVGALLKVMDANQKAQTLKSAINNMNFAMDSITREMRVGTNYYCMPGGVDIGALAELPAPRGCDAVGSWAIAFKSSETEPIDEDTNCNLIHVYWFDGSNILKWQQENCGEGPLGEGDFYPVVSGLGSTAEDDDAAIGLDAGYIKVVTGNGSQPYARIRFKGEAGVEVQRSRVRSAFDFQTTISQRLID